MAGLQDASSPLGDSDQELLHARAPLPDASAVRTMGLRLFILSLGVFFAGSLLVFVLTHLSRPPQNSPFNKPPSVSMWASTAVLFLAGLTVGAAAYYARRARVDEVKRWVKATFFVGIAFVAVQLHAIVQFLNAHEIALRKLSLGMEGVTFSLIGIHAVHVLGGLIPLGSLAWRAQYGRLGLEHLGLVRGCATYWHFLEVVWILMFVTFLITS